MFQALKITFRLILLLFAIPRVILAYIDPNTGGMLFQVLAVIVALSSAFILFFSRQIRASIARITRYFRERPPQ